MACPPIITHVDRACFDLWSKEDIKKISVKLITEPRSFEKKTGAVTENGLYSEALGPVKRMDICTTCGLNDMNCPGHYGHIELSVPVYHPMLVQTMYQIISKTCLECYRFRLAPPELTLFLAQLEALNNGFDHLVDQLGETATEICRNEKTKSDYLNIYLREQLDNMLKLEKSKTPSQEVQKRPQQRSIVERLSKLFRSFIQGQLIKPTKLCPHCNEKKQATTLQHQISIVLGVTGSKMTKIDDKIEAKGASAKKGKTPGWKNLHYLKQEDKVIMTPIGARHVMRQLWCNERHTMQRIFHFLNMKYDESLDDVQMDPNKIPDIKERLKADSRFRPTDLFFVDCLLVPPCKFRPPMSQRGYSFEGPRTAAIGSVMKFSVVVEDTIVELMKETSTTVWNKLQAKVITSWKDLQLAVHCLYDNEMDRYGKDKYPGLKQLIDKKEGLFRKNMMGKRVNFAARSVISPDPNISVDQIGVPMVFAKVLTYPQPVTPWNINQLREAVTNGPNKYPGAASVTFDDGVTISLLKESARLSIAARLNSMPPRLHPRNPKAKQDTPQVTTVNRHLLTGDCLLFNRQPTLHKPSIMAFRARVLPNEKGFRLHYANCKSFNADFDGDEMNAHLPQSELARSEAYNIVNVNHQYLVPKDGSPLGGLIQDHVIAPCILTRRDQFYDMDHYQQLVFCALQFLDKQIKLERPAMIKPEPLWTGKQIITTIIKNCIPPGKPAPTLKIKAKVGPKVMNVEPEYEQLSDCHVIISDGELITGLMDKSNVGATQYGLIHTCYELYGGETSSNLMSAFARLSTWFLQLYEGFTLGIADILCEEDADSDRKEKIRDSLSVGPESASEALGLTGSRDFDITDEVLEDKLREAHSDRNPLPMKKLDAAMKKRTDKVSSDISARCLPGGLIRRFPDNNLQMMIQSGAKGGTVNALQISCLLGQIELEGRRVPLSMSGRSLPSFKPYDTSPKAGGFVSGRFLTGIQPQEFFFHCMAGREGLIDTAVKTSRSGYLQRCLIKHLEGLTVHYDQTVRDSCGSVVQFLYGEDGLDITRSQMLKDKAYPLLVDNYKIVGPGEDELQRLNKAKELYEEDVIAQTDEIQQWLERNGDNRVRRPRGSGFLDFQTALLKNPEECKRLFGSDDAPFGKRASDIGVMTEDEKCHAELVKIKQELIDEEEKSTKNCDKSVEEDTADESDSEEERKKTAATGEEVKPTQSSLAAEQSWKKDKISEAWYALSFKEKRKWNKVWDTCPDPLIAVMNPGSHYGVVPEKLDEKIESFVNKKSSLIVNAASLLCGGMDARDSAAKATMDADFDANPELSKTLATLWDQIPGNKYNKPKMTKYEFYNLCYNLYMKMLAQPGEAVGLLAAQSIGEPSTQMTLNTFHFAGRGEMNVTLGIPRLREILMTASAKIGTPSMDLPLRTVMYDDDGEELTADQTEQQAHKVRLALNAVRLSDVLEYVDITEEVIDQDPNFQKPASSGTRSRKRLKIEGTNHGDQAIRYTFEFNFLSKKYYKHEYKTNTKKIMQFMEETFSTHLAEAVFKRMKRLLLAESIFDHSTRRMNKMKAVDDDSGAAASGGGEAQADVEEKDLEKFNENQKAKDNAEDGSSSEEDENDENDNTTARARNRQNPEMDYEEAEDEDLVVADADAVDAEAEEKEVEILGDEEVQIIANDTLDKEDAQAEIEAKQKISKKEKNEKKHRFTFSLSVPVMTTRLDMGALIEAEASRTYIHRVGQIQRALIVKDVNAKARGARCELMVKTEGVSLLSLVKFSHILDLNSIYTNDIHALARVYGIEAAAQGIRREMANVFAVYGIEVDPRHLSLIADYMTYSGQIRGMNRMSMEASASPFQQMSFESSIRYLKGAAVLGLHDDIRSPSAALVFGRPTMSGTGLLSTLTDPDTQKRWVRPPRATSGAPRPGQKFRPRQPAPTTNNSENTNAQAGTSAWSEVKDFEETEWW